MIYNDPTLKRIMVISPGTNSTAKQFFNPFYLVQNDPNCLTPDVLGTLSIPHSTAFIDIDGDCMPDLFITKQTYNDDGTPNSTIYEIYIQ